MIILKHVFQLMNIHSQTTTAQTNHHQITSSRGIEKKEY